MPDFTHKSKEDGKFDITQVDKEGVSIYVQPILDLQFGYFKHFRNGHIYKVDDFVWDGDRDLWMVKYHNIKDVNMHYVRTVKGFLSEVRPPYQEANVPRFERVETPESERG